MTKRLFLLFFLLFALSSFFSCRAEGAPPYFHFRDKSFRAEINGTQHGVSFCAEIGQIEREGKMLLYVKYLSPPSLEGILVERDGDGNTRLTRGEIDISTDQKRLSGLLLPLSLLFDEAEIVRVQKTEEGTALLLPDDLSLLLSKKGEPQRVTSPDANFEIVWWEESPTK